MTELIRAIEAEAQACNESSKDYSNSPESRRTFHVVGICLESLLTRLNVAWCASCQQSFTPTDLLEVRGLHLCQACSKQP